MEYGKPYHIITNELVTLAQNISVLLVCGIANPKPLKKYLAEQTASYEEVVYSDHHIFTIDDLKKIQQRFEQMQGDNKIIITTEKDAVRLHKFDEQLHDMPLYVLPVKPRFLFDGEKNFNEKVKAFIDSCTTV